MSTEYTTLSVTFPLLNVINASVRANPVLTQGLLTRMLVREAHRRGWRPSLDREEEWPEFTRAPFQGKLPIHMPTEDKDLLRELAESVPSKSMSRMIRLLFAEAHHENWQVNLLPQKGAH